MNHHGLPVADHYPHAMPVFFTFVSTQLSIHPIMRSCLIRDDVEHFLVTFLLRMVAKQSR